MLTTDNWCWGRAWTSDASYSPTHEQVTLLTPAPFDPHSSFSKGTTAGCGQVMAMPPKRRSLFRDVFAWDFAEENRAEDGRRVDGDNSLYIGPGPRL